MKIISAETFLDMLIKSSAGKLAPKLNSSEVIIVNSCGDSLKDKDIIKQKLGSYIR